MFLLSTFFCQRGLGFRVLGLLIGFSFGVGIGVQGLKFKSSRFRSRPCAEVPCTSKPYLTCECKSFSASRVILGLGFGGLGALKYMNRTYSFFCLGEGGGVGLP